MQHKIFFPYLDRIRFFAAFAIVLGHGFEAWEGYFSNGESSIYLSNFMGNSSIGVELFFFISGFLITYILLVEKEETGKIAIGKFFMRRALRIWPLYFLLIAIAPILVNWMGLKEPHYLANIFFVGNIDILHTKAWDFPFAHFWSIAVEEQFYVLWPFVIAFIPKKYLMRLFGFIILFSIGSRFMVFKYDPNSWNIYLNTLCRMDTIVIGAMAGLLYHNKQFTFQLKGWQLIALYTVFFLLLITTVSKSWPSAMTSMFKKFIYLIPLIPITIHFILKPAKKSTTKVVSTLNYLGKSSYGLYMIHNILILIVVKKIMLNNGVSNGVLFWLIYLVFTFLVVVISFEWYEKPILKLKRFFTIVKTRSY